MDKAALQHYCLEKMGIHQWQRRSLKRHYCLLVVNKEEEEDQQLIERILQALDWPASPTIVWMDFDDRESAQLFKQKVEEDAPEKVLVFGFRFAEQLGLSYQSNPAVFGAGKTLVAALPCLNSLKKDPILKKEAWRVMQALK